MTMPARAGRWCRSCGELNQQQIRPYRGGRWWVTTVKRIIRNPAYVGTKVFGRRCEGKYFQITQDGPKPLDAKTQPSAAPAVMQLGDTKG